MSSFIESLVYWAVKVFAAFMRLLPVGIALWVGRMIGLLGYYFDVRHKSQAHANIKMAFSETKSPNEIKAITKTLFKNYGQSLIELCRLPLINKENFQNFISIDGKEYVQEALKQNKGVILLVMHFGSWELASMSFAMLGSPYKVIVKPQKKFQRLNDLLNTYRSCGGSIVVSRGVQTREVIRGLKNNEIVAMVVDQGGRDGALVPFFGRQASLSVGALRMALKLGTPICFSIIIREKGHRHRLIIREPLQLTKTGDDQQDILRNLQKVVKVMEEYIKHYPAEYMWFYKIWKYSKESRTVILSDGKTGHLRQSQNVAQAITRALGERDVDSTVEVIDVKFKNKVMARLLNVIGLLTNPHAHVGRLNFLRFFLSPESFQKITSVKADFIVSCGSSVASLNYLLSLDHTAKSVAILKPGPLSFRKFSLVLLPQHDEYPPQPAHVHVAVTKGAPNLITKEYLKEQSQHFVERFPQLQYRQGFKIGFLLGGDAQGIVLDESRVKIVINQIKEAAAQLNVDILITTSRRTSARIDRLIEKEFEKHPRCQVLIIANKENVPEAIGGILGLSDVVVVSGDSISMVSEAATSGKKTIVFSLEPKREVRTKKPNKYDRFLENLHKQRHLIFTDASNVSQLIQDAAKNKIQTVPLNDNETILEAARKII